MLFELRNEKKYCTSCPLCAETRSKKSTRSLMVYRDDDGYIRYECMHPGCEWNERQFMKDINKEEVLTREEDKVEGVVGPFPDSYEGNKIWWYKDTEGKYLFGCMRRDNPTTKQKIYTPVRIVDGEIKTKNTTWPNIKTLYGAEHLNDFDSVVVVEGEKAAEAGNKIFKKAAVVTWRGGAKNISSADWELLKDKKVILWPDNDEAGINIMNKVGELLPVLEYRIAKVDHLPPKADLADGLSHKDIVTALEEATVVDKLSGGRMSTDDLENQHEQLNHRLETGIELIDEHVRLPMSGMVVIEGRTKHGKSAAAVNLCRSMLLTKNKKIIYFSYEMPASRVVARFVRSMNPEVTIEEAFKSKEYLTIKDKINSELIVFDQKAQISGQELLNILDNARWSGSVVVLDNLQLIPLKGSDRFQALKNFIDRVRVLANTYGYIVLALSQVTPNRSNPLLDSPRESAEIHNSAEMVLRVWNKLKYTKHPIYDSVKGNFALHVLLNRDAEADQVLGFNFIAGARLEPKEILTELPTRQEYEREELSPADIKALVGAVKHLSDALILSKGEL